MNETRALLTTVVIQLLDARNWTDEEWEHVLCCGIRAIRSWRSGASLPNARFMTGIVTEVRNVRDSKKQCPDATKSLEHLWATITQIEDQTPNLGSIGGVQMRDDIARHLTNWTHADELANLEVCVLRIPPQHRAKFFERALQLTDELRKL